MRIWQEGFETSPSVNQASRKYAFVSGGGSTTSGRTGGLALLNTLGVTRVTPSLGLKNTMILGWGVLVANNVADTATDGLYFERGLAEQIHLHLRTESTYFEIDVYRGATLMASTTEQFTYGNWHYFEIEVTFHTSTGAYTLRQNEQTVLTASGVNTAGSGSNGADIFALRVPTNHGGAFAWDDIYLNDDTGSVNNGFNGDTFIRGVLPNGEGAYLQWTTSSGGTHYTLVDDPGTSPPDAGYVSSDTNGQKDSFQFADLTGVTGTIQAVMLEVQAAMASAGSRTIRPFFRDSGASEATGANMVVSSPTYASFLEIFEQNPVSASAWLVSDLDDGQWGVEVVS